MAGRFDAVRPRLHALALRMLGSHADAEDAVQEAWMRLSRPDQEGISNLQGWLTTVVARICLDTLRSRRLRREEPLHPEAERLVDGGACANPGGDVELADSVGAALLVVLDRLEPAERVAFVLHDLFAVPFEAIAPIVERSPAAARKLASRARRRLRGDASSAAQDPMRTRAVVAAFLAASRDGDLTALLALLDPDVVLRADPLAARRGGLGAAETRGAQAVGALLNGRAQAAELGLVGDAPGLVVMVGGEAILAIGLEVVGDRICEVRVTAEQEALARLAPTPLRVDCDHAAIYADIT